MSMLWGSIRGFDAVVQAARLPRGGECVEALLRNHRRVPFVACCSLCQVEFGVRTAMGIETWNTFPKSLSHFPKSGTPLPCSDQHPRLKCPETRWARDYCLASGGACEYKIEAHFDCLEQYYDKEKVDVLRKNFKPSVLDVPTSDVYLRYRHFYMGFPMGGKQNWEGSW